MRHPLLLSGAGELERAESDRSLPPPLGLDVDEGRWADAVVEFSAGVDWYETQAGLGLEDSPAGYGALITSVLADSPAHVAGLEAGQTIVSVDGQLCPASHSAVAKMIENQHP